MFVGQDAILSNTFLAEHQRYRPEKYLAVPLYSASQAIGELV